MYIYIYVWSFDHGSHVGMAMMPSHSKNHRQEAVPMNHGRVVVGTNLVARCLSSLPPISQSPEKAPQSFRPARYKHKPAGYAPHEREPFAKQPCMGMPASAICTSSRVCGHPGPSMCCHVPAILRTHNPPFKFGAQLQQLQAGADGHPYRELLSTRNQTGQGLQSNRPGPSAIQLLEFWE